MAQHWCELSKKTVGWSANTCALCWRFEQFQPNEPTKAVDLYVIVENKVDPIVIGDVHPESPEIKGEYLIAESRHGERLYTIPHPVYWWTEV